MKQRALKLFVWFLLLAFAGCQSSVDPIERRETKAIIKSEVVYGLGDEALDFLGNRLGCHVEALGMGEYSFANGNHVFHVMVHNDMLAADRIRATEPVVLSYGPPGGKVPLEMRFSVAQGVTLAEVEAHFRKFLRQIVQP